MRTLAIGLALFFSFCISKAQNSLLDAGISSLQGVGIIRLDGALEISGDSYFYNHMAITPYETCLEEIDLSFDFSIQERSGSHQYKVQFGKKSAVAGTMLALEGNDESCLIRLSKLDETSTILARTSSLPEPLLLFQHYKMVMKKRMRALHYELYKGSTLVWKDSALYPITNYGCFWGSPFISATEGRIHVYDYQLSTPSNTSPKLSIWGDSFIEGASLTTQEDRYAYQLKEAIGFDEVSILGRGGENSNSLFTRFETEARWFKGSQYAIVAIGINEKIKPIWLSNMEQHLQRLKEKHIIPIIVTLTPKDDRLDYVMSVNEWMREDYNGLFVDINEELCEDEVVWKDGHVLPDNLHPSELGHSQIFRRFEQEAPYLFREEEAFGINFLTESTIHPLPSGFIYDTSARFFHPSEGLGSTVPLYPGQYHFFKNLSSSHSKQVYDAFYCPERPEAPTRVAAFSFKSEFDWNFSDGFSSYQDYEYSTDEGLSWQLCASKPLVNIAQSSILLRVKAGENHFKSESVELIKNVDVYPNPFSQVLRFKHVIDPIQGAIYQTDGRLVSTFTISETDQEFATGHLKPGAYILVLKSEGQTCSYKLLKEN